MINRAVLTGRLTRDPELRHTQSGVAVGRFNLAVDRQFRSKNGDRQTDFISCQIWRKSAESFCSFTHKGSKVGIDGHIQTGSYEKNGQRVYTTDVVVDNFALLDDRQNQQNQQRQQSGYIQEPAPQQTQPQQGLHGNDTSDISDDDLPF